MPEKKHPVVSVITPVYNSENFVSDAIKSVLEQNFTDWEMIIVDDCSTDNSVEVCMGFAGQDSRIRVMELDKHSGPAVARNAAIRVAAGRYIAFLDSDDFWHRNKLDLQLELFKRTGAPLAYSAYEKIDEKKRNKNRIISVPESIDYYGLLNATVIATVTAVYDTARVGKVMMPDILKRQDYALWLKILRIGGKAYAVSKPLACLRKRSGSVSSNKLSAMRYTWMVYRRIEKLSVGRSIYHFFNYAVRALIKNL
ncbi:MAG: glycosyltransferase family 2 protein [Desulfatiglandaceae bacterium]